MDFYTITTSINIVKDEEALAILHNRIGFYCQPDIMGNPYKDGKKYHLRFALRKDALLHKEEEIIEGLGGKFTPKNTKIIKADRV